MNTIMSTTVHDEEEDEHEHCCHHHHDEEEDEHEHCCHHHHEEDEDEHEHHHEHDENCTCGCHDHDHHHHHHADEIFTSWGFETPATYTTAEVEGFLKELDDKELQHRSACKGYDSGSRRHMDLFRLCSRREQCACW